MRGGGVRKCNCAKYYLVGPDIILMALAIYILLIHYCLPLNHDFTEPVFSHTSSTSDMVNKLNHILTLSSTYWKMSCELYQPILGIKIKLYSSKYFIQYNPEVKNNFTLYFHKTVLPKMVCYCLNTSNQVIETLNQTAGYLPLLMRSCFPASATRAFCLIRYSILIGFFNILFGKTHSFAAKTLTQANFFFSRTLLQRKDQYLKTNSL